MQRRTGSEPRLQLEANDVRVTQKYMQELARDERASLGISDHEPLDPYALCEEHGVRVYTVESLRSFGASSEAILHFTSLSTATWSAALVPVGSARIIIENETHAPVRRRSSIAHELGHFLLEHEFNGALLGEDHKRQFDPAKENRPRTSQESSSFRKLLHDEQRTTAGTTKESPKPSTSAPSSPRCK